MGTLDVQAAGPSEAAWRARTATLPVWTVPAGLHAVVVSPHPDDETLGLGGTLRRIVAAGGRVELLAVTDGEASHPGLPGLAARRRRELRAALAALGVHQATRIVGLGLPDGAVAAHRASLVERLRHLPTGPDVCWFAPAVDDGHPDHEAVAGVVTEVAAARGARRLHFPVWAWQWHDPAGSGLLDGAWRVPLSAADRQAKRAAVATYVSQTTSQGGSPPIVPAHVLDRLLRDHEVVVP